MWRVRRGPPQRWRFALRAAISMGVPILVGWLAGDVAAGMMAATGGFTSLYGSGRPYLSRARELAVIAAAFALSVAIGLAAAQLGWLVVPVVALLAMLATWLGNAFQIGPPGAYMFLLACAAASGILTPATTPMEAGLLVLAGGGFAWCMHMLGALFEPRGPEKRAVVRAGDAVIAYVQALGTPRQDEARHEAAHTLHHTWKTLVTHQPADARPGGRLTGLRAVNRRMHLLFADAMAAAARGTTLPGSTVDDLRELQALARQTVRVRVLPPDAVPGLVPLGRPAATTVLREALSPGTMSRMVVLRVGVAALLAGWVGAQFQLERSYWAVATAVLMLHQGFHWHQTLVRSIERLIGTWVGLLLAAAILLLYPQGLWLVATVMLLQFVVEMLVLRNYALAVVFITCAALVLASGGHPVEAPGAYVLARGVDTAVGCLVALLVYRAMPSRAAATLPAELAGIVRGVQAVVPHLAGGAVGTLAARAARRDLQRGSFSLEDAYSSAVAASPAQRREAERQWPAVAAAQQLAYRSLSACWMLERLDADAAIARAGELFGPGGGECLLAELQRLADAVAAGRVPPAPGPLPALLERELQNLQECLAREPPAPVS
jgi:uncharacterized membrane protein YccC